MEIKVSLLKRQLWMADEDEFSHVKFRIIEVKSLASKKYKNYPYVEEFMRDWKVIFSYGIYMLERGINSPPPPPPPCEIWNNSEYKSKVIQRRLLHLISAFEYLQLEPDLTPEKLKHVQSMIMQQEKHVLIKEYRKHQLLQASRC